VKPVRTIMSEIKKKRRRIFVLIIGVLAVAGFLFFFTGSQSIPILLHSRGEVRQLKEKIRQAGKAIDSLTIEIQRLKTDTVYIEKIAREKLGMARKNEKVYKFIEQETKAP